jgi:hypothetical protein
MKTFIKIILFILICFLFLQFNQFQINEFNYKPIKEKNIITDQKQLEQNTQLVKDVLLKVAENQIKDENIVNRYFINKTIDQMSKQLAVYYDQIINFKNNPEKAVTLANDIIQNSQAYIEAAAIYLEQQLQNLNLKYEKIKNKYCTGFFDCLFNNQTWKDKLNFTEIEELSELEYEIEQISNVLKIIKRTQSLFHIIDWSINSKSPFAWIVRQFLI